MATVNPARPTGIVDAPKDRQYDVPHQMVKPLVFPENAKDEHDLRNVYNPNRKVNTGDYNREVNPRAWIGNSTANVTS